MTDRDIHAGFKGGVIVTGADEAGKVVTGKDGKPTNAETEIFPNVGKNREKAIQAGAPILESTPLKNS